MYNMYVTKPLESIVRARSCRDIANLRKGIIIRLQERTYFNVGSRKCLCKVAYVCEQNLGVSRRRDARRGQTENTLTHTHTH